MNQVTLSEADDNIHHHHTRSTSVTALAAHIYHFTEIYNNFLSTVTCLRATWYNWYLLGGGPRFVVLC